MTIQSTFFPRSLLLLVLACVSPQELIAKDSKKISQISTHMGEMSATIDANGPADQRASLQFEPWQMLDDLYRSDVVLLMRHGRTDWSVRDIENVAPNDCANQRILSEKGHQDMEDLGILLLGNGIRPGKLVVSEWCRNQQTLDALTRGFELVDPKYANGAVFETNPDANLLLSLQGAPTVQPLREMITDWTGQGHSGPLLILTHFTNISELTDFYVYEGEILVIDPKRNNRVLGYLRLRDAAPDVGHFDTAVVERQ